jgi:hypothetical protein
LTVRQLQRFEELIPEIRAQERLDESMVALAAVLRPKDRMRILKPWMDLAHGSAKPAQPKDHGRAWDSLRTMIRAGK